MSIPPATTVPASPSVADAALHGRRVRRMIQFICAMSALTGLVWGTLFAYHGVWPGAVFQALPLVLAAAALGLLHQQRQRAATRLVVVAMYATLCAAALLLDVPTAGTGRSVHLFLIALGVLSAQLLLDEPRWIRLGAPAVCLATYLLFASTDAGWVTPLLLPDAVRVPTAWVNHALAVVLVFAGVQVLLSDVTVRDGREAELRDALVRGELQLHFQPQVDAAGRVVGAEALVRWLHPRRGLLGPAEFIPLAERSGLMVPLGDQVLRAACQQLAAWRHQRATAGLQLAVNVSAAEFARPDFVERVLACVAQAGADPARLKLELTESLLVHDLDDVVAKMTALKARGIAFSLDDFGTGFSSLAYLRRLPFDQLKIDRAFVHGMLESPGDAAIAQAVVSLGRSLHLEVIAEGVETPDHCRALSTMGCHRYQGYLFGRPQPVADFEALVGKLAAGPPLAVPRPAPAPAGAGTPHTGAVADALAEHAALTA